MRPSRRLVTFAALLLGGLAHAEPPARAPRDKEIIVGISYGDQLSYSPENEALTSPERFDRLFAHYRKAGVDTVFFRVEDLRVVTDFEYPDPRITYKDQPPEVAATEFKQWHGSREAVRTNLVKHAVARAHAHGLKIFALSSIFNEGMPLDEVWWVPGDRRDSVFANITKPARSSMISKFVAAHPEFVMVDRSQRKHNWGTLELAFPEARAYAVGYNRRFLDNDPFDGIAVNFRNEFGHPEFGDQYGFGQPIVDEYRRRHGVDILREQFDLDRWRRLCGEYLTQFIRELSQAVRGKGRSLIVGIGQGNHIGLPNGNMYVDWQGWVKDRVVDGLLVGDITQQFLFPNRVGYGYVVEQESGIGVPNILWALQNEYWPLCASHGVKLYAIPRRFKDIPLGAFMKTSVDGVVVGMDQVGPNGIAIE